MNKYTKKLAELEIAVIDIAILASDCHICRRCKEFVNKRLANKPLHAITFGVVTDTFINASINKIITDLNSSPLMGISELRLTFPL